jgi:ketosteroid isomerase-like protein
MSQENVERMKLFYERLNEGGIAAVLTLFDPNVEWWTRADSPETAVVKGHDGVSALWSEITDVLEELRVEPTQIIDAGEYVVVSLHQVAHTRGMRIEQHEVHVIRLRDGSVVEIREYHEKDEALNAIGLGG